MIKKLTIIKKKSAFTDYLMGIHAANYIGTDDMLVDDYEKWRQELDIDDVIKWADDFIARKEYMGV